MPQESQIVGEHRHVVKIKTGGKDVGAIGDRYKCEDCGLQTQGDTHWLRQQKCKKKSFTKFEE